MIMYALVIALWHADKRTAHTAAGYTMMQDPFDMLAIQMILFELKPDLIIETGTANGGSALLWASLLDIMGLKSTK